MRENVSSTGASSGSRKEIVMKAGARRGVTVWLVAPLLVVSSCVQVLGDFKPEGGGGSKASSSQASTSGSSTSSSGGATTSTGAGGATSSSATTSTGSSSSSSGPPPVVGRPGSDLTSGGQISTSASYKLVGAVSESPGQNGSSASPNYQAVTGIIGTTQ
jgi:hypothetical protein